MAAASGAVAERSPRTNAVAKRRVGGAAVAMAADGAVGGGALTPHPVGERRHRADAGERGGRRHRAPACTPGTARPRAVLELARLLPGHPRRRRRPVRRRRREGGPRLGGARRGAGPAARRRVASRRRHVRARMDVGRSDHGVRPGLERRRRRPGGSGSTSTGSTTASTPTRPPPSTAASVARTSAVPRRRPGVRIEMRSCDRRARAQFPASRRHGRRRRQRASHGVDFG